MNITKPAFLTIITNTDRCNFYNRVKWLIAIPHSVHHLKD